MNKKKRWVSTDFSGSSKQQGPWDLKRLAGRKGSSLFETSLLCSSYCRHDYSPSVSRYGVCVCAVATFQSLCQTSWDTEEQEYIAHNPYAIRAKTVCFFLDYSDRCSRSANGWRTVIGADKNSEGQSCGRRERANGYISVNWRGSCKRESGRFYALSLAQ